MIITTQILGMFEFFAGSVYVWVWNISINNKYFARPSKILPLPISCLKL